MTPTSAIYLSYVYLERKQVKQLSSIRTLAFVIALQTTLASAVPVTEPQQSGSLLITMTESRRLKPDEVELHITIHNETDHDLYLPTYGSSESPATISLVLTVYHWDAEKGWRPLGFGSEFPPDPGMRLSPGQSYTFVTLLSDPMSTHNPANGIPGPRVESVPLQGRHKIRIGFYRSKAEWQSYRNYFEYVSGKVARGKKPGPRPRMSFADSAVFDIPQAKSR